MCRSLQQLHDVDPASRKASLIAIPVLARLDTSRGRRFTGVRGLFAKAWPLD
jgi:hypothetical protein